MQTIVFLAFALSAQAVYANWFKAVCDKALNSMAVQDPYQFEQTDTDYLIKELHRLGVKTAWQRATPDDKELLVIVRTTLELRLHYLSDAREVEKILKALKEVKA